MTLDTQLAELPADVAVPRSNGEPVFSAPWEARAFGMVATLHANGVFPWEDFKRRLIANIAEHPELATGEGYYGAWVAAFHELLLERRLLLADEVDQRQNEFMTGRRQDLP